MVLAVSNLDPESDNVDIYLVLDRSGSMASIRDDTIGSVNTFIQEQKDIGDNATLTLVLFNDKEEIVINNKPIAEVEELTRDVYRVGSSTSLLDAIGNTIDLASRRSNENGHRVFIAVLTDGEENTSSKFTKEEVKKLVDDNNNDPKWEILFLGASLESIEESQSLGITNNIAFDATSAGIISGLTTISSRSTSFRGNSSFINEPQGQMVYTSTTNASK